MGFEIPQNLDMSKLNQKRSKSFNLDITAVEN